MNNNEKNKGAIIPYSMQKNIGKRDINIIRKELILEKKRVECIEDERIRQSLKELTDVTDANEVLKIFQLIYFSDQGRGLLNSRLLNKARDIFRRCLNIDSRLDLSRYDLIFDRVIRNKIENGEIDLDTVFIYSSEKIKKIIDFIVYNLRNNVSTNFNTKKMLNRKNKYGETYNISSIIEQFYLEGGKRWKLCPYTDQELRSIVEMLEKELVVYVGDFSYDILEIKNILPNGIQEEFCDWFKGNIMWKSEEYSESRKNVDYKKIELIKKGIMILEERQRENKTKKRVVPQSRSLDLLNRRLLEQKRKKEQLEMRKKELYKTINEYKTIYSKINTSYKLKWNKGIEK